VLHLSRREGELLPLGNRENREKKMLLLERWVEEANKHLGISVEEVRDFKGSDVAIVCSTRKRKK